MTQKVKLIMGLIAGSLLGMQAEAEVLYWGYVNSGYGINAHNPYQGSNANVWSWDMWDDEQQWIWEGHNLRRKGTNYCLNAYNPSSGSNVNLWSCNSSDTDQHWNLKKINSSTFAIEKRGTNLCLNAHNRYNSGNLNLWQCDYSDPDQQFKQIFYHHHLQEGVGMELTAIEEVPGILLW